MNYIMKNTLMHHTFRSRRYRIIKINPRAKDRKGQCDEPKLKGKTIEIPIGDSLADLDVQIHEAIHASFWELDEESVTIAGMNISKFLWRLGWRRMKDFKINAQ